MTNLGVDIFRQPCPDGRVDLLGLLGSGRLARADGPNRLIRDHDPAPVRNVVRDRLELPEADLGGLARLSLLQLLPDAGYDI